MPYTLHAYLINLVSARQRLTYASEKIAEAGFSFTVIEAVDGRLLPQPHPAFSARAFALKHGKSLNPSELGCYLSHIKALEAFIATKDSHALILEDDISFSPGAAGLLHEALRHARLWDMLRLSGLHNPLSVAVLRLDGTHRLCVDLTRQTGAGAYVVNRRTAALLLRKLLPMTLPYDHIFDRNWALGFRTLSLHPRIADQVSAHGSQIVGNRQDKFPAWKRYWTVFPYRTCVESARFVCRCLSVLAIALQRRLGT